MSHRHGTHLFYCYGQVSITVPQLSDLSSWSAGGDHIASAIRVITFLPPADAANASMGSGGGADMDDRTKCSSASTAAGGNHHSCGVDVGVSVDPFDAEGRECNGEELVCDAGSFCHSGEASSENQADDNSGVKNLQDPRVPAREDSLSRAGTPETARTLRLSLSVYWVVMTLAVLSILEHQRRTEGLLLRRIKTFCLAGFVILTLKMTRKQTRVRRSSPSDFGPELHG